MQENNEQNNMPSGDHIGMQDSDPLMRDYNPTMPEKSSKGLNMPQKPMMPKIKMNFKINKNNAVVLIAIIVVIATIILVVFNSGSGSILSFLTGSSKKDQAIAQQAINYLNSNVLQQGQTATLGDV